MEQEINTTEANPQTLVAPLRYCLYSRKSTESDELQSLSIKSQITEMTRIAQKNGLKIVEIKRESHSAKATGQRIVFNEMLKEINEGKFNAILTWAPDRLSRNAGDLGAIVDLIDQKLIHEVRTFGQRFTNNPNEKFLLMILGAQGKLENDQKGVNVKRGLRARCEMGLWPAPAPTGYLNSKNVDEKCKVTLDPKRASTIKQMFEKVAYEEWSGRRIYRWLKEINFRTKNGRPLSLSNVYIILNSSFYYGVFEYPKNSGNYYAGKHQPIITKELFEKTKEQLAKERHERINNKEFAFTKLMKCGFCGSGITADEKFKKLKDGSTNRHVYYLCTKSKNIDCKNKYINEKDLIEQLIKIIDEVNLDKIGMKEKLEKEVERYHKFRSGVLGIKENENQKNKRLNMKNYAKYILKEGNLFEKRELLSCLKSKLALKNKEIFLEK